AVQNDLGVTVRDRLLDVALDDPLREMDGAAGVALLPLAVLAHVDEVEPASRLLTALDLLRSRLLDARLRVGDERQECGRMLHRQQLGRDTARTTSAAAASGVPRTMSACDTIPQHPPSASTIGKRRMR